MISFLLYGLLSWWSVSLSGEFCDKHSSVKIFLSFLFGRLMMYQYHQILINEPQGHWFFFLKKEVKDSSFLHFVLWFYHVSISMCAFINTKLLAMCLVNLLFKLIYSIYFLFFDKLFIIIYKWINLNVLDFQIIIYKFW